MISGYEPETETRMRNTPDFQTLSVDTIPALSDESLVAAACAAIDTLGDGARAFEAVLEMMEPNEAATLRAEFWGVQLNRDIRKIPDTSSFEAEEVGTGTTTPIRSSPGKSKRSSKRRGWRSGRTGWGGSST